MKLEVGKKYKKYKNKYVRYSIITNIENDLVCYKKYYVNGGIDVCRTSIEFFKCLYDPFEDVREEKQEEKKQKELDIHERREWFNKKMRV